MGQKRAKKGDRVELLYQKCQGVIIKRIGSYYQVAEDTGFVGWYPRIEFKTLEQCSVEELLTHSSDVVRTLAENKLGNVEVSGKHVLQVGDEVFVRHYESFLNGVPGIIVFMFDPPDARTAKNFKIAIGNTNIYCDLEDFYYVRTLSIEELCKNRDKVVRFVGEQLRAERDKPNG